jgi:hypothetical protein
MDSSAGTAEELVTRYSWAVDQIHGIFLDATMAMGQLAQGYMQYDANRLDELRKKGQLTPELFNPKIVYRGNVKGDPAELHVARVHDLIDRNAPGGTNWIFLGQMCVVGIYQFWEDHYRKRLARALNTGPGALKADVFGELRHLRRSIIHNGGYAVPEVARLQMLRSFAPGELITLKPQDIHDLAEEVKAAVRSFLRPANTA